MTQHEQLDPEVLFDEVERLCDHIDAALVLHQPTKGMGDHSGEYGDLDPVCTTCGTPGEYGVPWPCPTTLALTEGGSE